MRDKVIAHLTSTAHAHRELEALDRSEEALIEVLGDLEWTDAREHLLLDLLEHETQHQGQLIRYVYALDRPFPESWATRWALEQPRLADVRGPVGLTTWIGRSVCPPSHPAHWGKSRGSPRLCRFGAAGRIGG